MQALIATSDDPLGGLPPFYRATPASIERASLSQSTTNRRNLPISENAADYAAG